MSTLSKLAKKLDVPVVRAVAEAVPMSFLFSIKTYGTLYCITGLMKMVQTGQLKWKNIAVSTLRSATFLTFNMAAYLYLTCKIRQLFGFYFFGTFYIAGFLGSLLAIILEQKKRQSMLTLYLTNLASESLFLQLRNRKYVRGVTNGETILFSIGLAALLYFKEKGTVSDIQSILKHTHSLNYKAKEVIRCRLLPSPLFRLLSKLRLHYLKADKCQHNHSCVSSIVERTVKNFKFGLIGSTMLAVFQSLKRPNKLISNVTSLKSLKLAVFAALLPLIYHTADCTLNRYLEVDRPLQASLCGMLSGLAMLVYPSSTVALYILWKAIEQCYHYLHEKGVIPSIKYGNILLYSFSTGIVVGNVIIEPHAVRAGYYNFINSLTLNKINLFNRPLLDPLGFHSSQSFFWDFAHLQPVKPQ